MDKYDVHQELEASTDKVLQQVDERVNEIDAHLRRIEFQINNVKHIADLANWQSIWFFGILSACIAGAIVSALLH